VGVICHAPWTLVEADLVRERTITSWPSLQTDIRNAGGNWVDEEVVVEKASSRAATPTIYRRSARRSSRSSSRASMRWPQQAPRRTVAGSWKFVFRRLSIGAA
jgi:hypothetical protein